MGDCLRPDSSFAASRPPDMTDDSFTLRPTDEYIELNQLLKLWSLVQSGGHAKIVITQGEVRVNGEEETRVRRKLRAGDQVSFGESVIEIRRAGT